ncbi:MAG: CHAT domain-containing protein [Blastocatellia bacterium]|nr:CHAT domain-containing protein [Blastocatellia bacterium]
MPNCLFRLVGLCVLGWLFVRAGQVMPASAQAQGQPTPYDFQSPLLRELKGGEKHSYPISLKANDYLKLVVDQKGIDVVVRLVGPDGKTIQEVDSPNGTQGPEPVSFIVVQEGSYSIEVESPEKTAPAGKYEVKPEAMRVATEADRTQVEIEQLNLNAQRLSQAGKFAQALPLVQQALEKAEKVFGTEHPVVAENLNHLAELYRAQGDYPQAGPLYVRSLAIREKTLGAEHPLVAISLNNLAELYNDKGEYSQAEPLYERSLRIMEKTLGGEHLEIATNLNNLAGLYRNKGEYAKAVPLLMRSLAIREQVLGRERPEVAQSLNNLAAVYRDQGDTTRAEPLYERSLRIAEKVLGAEHPEVADFLNNLAVLYRDQGEYAKAVPLLERSLGIYEKTLGAVHPDVARSLNNLAGFYREKGDYTRAEPLFLRSLAIWEKTLGADHPNVARTLNNLAGLYRTKGEYAKAEPLFLRSLAIYEKALGGDHPLVATSLHNLAGLYRDQGAYARAEPLYLKSLAIYEKALGADHRDVAGSLNNLAELYGAQGDYTRAEPLYLRSLRIWEKALGGAHPDVGRSLNNLALLYEAKGETAQAIQYRARSNDATERDLLRNLVAGSENQKTLYLKQTNGATDQTISLHLQAAPHSREAQAAALTVVLRRKGRPLDAMTTAIETLRRRQTPATQKLLDDYASLAGQISVLTLRGPGKKKPAEHVAALQELEAQKDKLEAEISAKSAEFKAQVTPVTLEQVQRQLPRDGVLVEYVAYRPFDAKTQKYGTSRYAVYTLNQAGEINWADLGSAELIDQAVASLRKALSQPQTSLVKDIAPAAQALDKLVLKPIRAVVGKTSHLLLSPDGALNLIPFAALMDERGKFLVETCTLTYLTSGRDVLRLAVKSASQDPPLVLTDPDYAEGKGPELLGHAFKPLARLTGTHEEGRQIKALLPAAQLKMEAEATEAALKQARKPALVHIATHGYFLADAGAETAAEQETRLLERQQENQPVDVEKLRQANPLLRSWLFFAGANRGGNADNDGTMTALEAAQLDLWGTKLVTLSACDTGLGDVKNGDGVYGLRRALVLAGSEAQLMSLWPVSDQGTRELMVAYYTRLKAGEGRSEALRKVQLALLKNPKRQHPYYWAAFIQSGEWANLAGRRQ